MLCTSDNAKIESILRKLDASHEELKEFNSKLVPFIADGDLESEHLSVLEYEERTNSDLSLIQDGATQLRSNESPRPSVSTVGSHNEERAERRHSGIRLPELELQSFKGELSEWQQFWKQFKRTIHCKNFL